MDNPYVIDLRKYYNSKYDRIGGYIIIAFMILANSWITIRIHTPGIFVKLIALDLIFISVLIKIFVTKK